MRTPDQKKRPKWGYVATTVGSVIKVVDLDLDLDLMYTYISTSRRHCVQKSACTMHH